MIFLTVGSEIRFDRLTQAVDRWCAEHPDIEVFGQLAELGEDGYRPQHFDWQEFLNPEDYQKRFDDADAIIAHAGMGSIIAALTSGKPIVILPRRAALRETRNDHQVATALRFANRQGVLVAETENKIPECLDRFGADVERPARIGEFAEPSLLEALREFIGSS